MDIDKTVTATGLRDNLKVCLKAPAKNRVVLIENRKTVDKDVAAGRLLTTAGVFGE
jgi:hypothetical protein